MLPESLNIISGQYDKNDVINMSIFAYKEFAISVGKGEIFNIGKATQRFQKKYKKYFEDITVNLCNIVYAVNPRIKLLHYEFIKLCLDYFNELHNDYEKRGLNGFKVNQIASIYAMEVFLEFCNSEYGSIRNYLEKIFPKIKKFGNTFKPDPIILIGTHNNPIVYQKIQDKTTKVDGLFELEI